MPLRSSRARSEDSMALASALRRHGRLQTCDLDTLVLLLVLRSSCYLHYLRPIHSTLGYRRDHHTCTYHYPRPPRSGMPPI
jgi:hypothetical protein